MFRTCCVNGPQSLQDASILEDFRKRQHEVGQIGKQIESLPQVYLAEFKDAQY